MPAGTAVGARDRLLGQGLRKLPPTFDRLDPPVESELGSVRNVSDLGITLLELLAYEGDHLSYFQDAVANEAYLDTARQRSSAKKHARLVDYPMHDGRNGRSCTSV